ncbi:MAG: sigma 54-interacting transcriptional regulator, partial [Spirochaetota bacterium]
MYEQLDGIAELEENTGRDKFEELSLLFEISQLLDQSLDLHRVVHPVLQSVTRHLGYTRGIITLLDRQTGDIFIEAAHGLSETQKERGRYKLGEGITGKVVESGKSRIIPRVADDPGFLNKTGARKGQRQKDISFICVPIKLGNETIGAFGVDRPYDPGKNLEDDARLLSIISSLIAQAVKIRQSVMEEKRQLQEENTRLHEELRARFKPSNIIGNSKAMQEVFDMIAQVSRSEATVLIRGESGTGKELVAQAIHYNSLRSAKPFIKVNCAALPESVIESELFGHEKGSFTGAIQTRK